MSDQHYYIMNASEHLFDGCATDLTGMVDAWGEDQTILVCRRNTKYGVPIEEGARIFVSGAGGGDYYVKKDMELPVHGSYTQDTGMGHKFENYPLFIENIIRVSKGADGKPKFTPRNNIGIGERRRAWCMK